MRDDLANQLHDVLLHGLKLRDRVAGGDRPHLGTEQAKLKGMLGSANAPAPWGSESDPTASIGTRAGDRGFLGMRYALACWLDEILIEAGWREWDENKLESALYRTNIRYSNFWNQARLADATPHGRGGAGSFLLCVLLGFRGETGRTARQAARVGVGTQGARHARAGQGPARVAAEEPGHGRAAAVGVEKYRKMMQRLVGGVLVAVLATAFLVVLLMR